MYLLKQSTAGQEVPLGYFLDSTDGDTEETALTINNTDIKLHKTGATTLANKSSGGGTHISNGIYYTTLDATDTDTLGPMVVFVHVAGALAIKLECLVVTSARYDVLTGTTVDAPQTGDTFALANGAAGFVAIDTVVDAILVDTNELQTNQGDWATATGFSTHSAADVWTANGRALSDPAGFKRNTQADITFVMRDSSDGRTPIASETVTAQRSLDKGAFASCANSVVEIGNGAYGIVLAAADLNADIVILRFTSTGADDLLITIKTET